MIVTLFIITVGPEKFKFSGCDADTVRYPPLGGKVIVVGDIHAAQLNRINAGVVYLEPVGLFIWFLRVGDGGAVGGHHFVDHHRRAHLQPVAGKRDEIIHVDAHDTIEVGTAGIGPRTEALFVQPLPAQYLQVQHGNSTIAVQVAFGAGTGYTRQDSQGVRSKAAQFGVDARVGKGNDDSLIRCFFQPVIDQGDADRLCFD